MIILWIVLGLLVAWILFGLYLRFLDAVYEDTGGKGVGIVLFLTIAILVVGVVNLLG